MYPYHTEEEAIEDALCLSMGMTYKCAAAGVNLGGGKCVIWGDPNSEKSEALFRALGRFVQTLGGRFSTGNDLGTVKEDFVWARLETPYVGGLPEEYGGGGDTAVITAFGVWRGLQAAAKWYWGIDSLQGKRVAVQGVGKVGHHLVKYLLKDGAECIISDMMPDRVEVVRKEHPDIEMVEPQAIYDVDCQIFSPNAVGAILNDKTIPRMKCKVIGGSANNQLLEPRHGDMLEEYGILYCPDFVINSGGLIQVADEQQGFNRDRAFRKASAIYGQMIEIFNIGKNQKISTHKAAMILAEERIHAIKALKHIYIPH